MKRSPILSPEGEPVFMAGGDNCWRQHVHRGYVVSLEWIGDGRRHAPCMVIWSEAPGIHVFGAPQVSDGMWVISRRAITEFVGAGPDGIKVTGGPSEHCWRECREAMPMMGKDPNDKQALTALVDCIVRFAPDLVRMPVAPVRLQEEFKAPPMWDVTVTNKSTGKVITEGEA